MRNMQKTRQYSGTGIMGITEAIILVVMGEVIKIRTQRNKT
jgi:hypothetical protein